jgi:hypothetical protein
VARILAPCAVLFSAH